MMKKVSVLLGAVAIVGITAAIYSFTSDNEPDGPEFKKYEVIRIVNGEVTTFDTIVDSKSEYTPEAYLAELGFNDDENINIINLMDLQIPHFAMEMHGDCSDKIEGEKMIFIELNEGGTGDTIKHETITEGALDIRVEKKVIKSDLNGDEEVQVEIDIDGLMESLNIDSIIAVAMEGHNKGEGPVVMQKVIILDEEMNGKQPEMDMKIDKIDLDGADYHKKIEGPNHKMEVAVWNEGDDKEDFTLLIVSDPAMSAEQNVAKIQKNSVVHNLKLFPNPANETTKLQLNFEDNAPTAIRVTDVNGKIVAVLELGNFSGQYDHEFNVKKWSKGVYMVHVEHGNEKIIEKLIVE